MSRFVKGGTWKGLTGPKSRPACPVCGKKGMSPWKHTPPDFDRLHRDCRYCLHVELKAIQPAHEKGAAK